MASNPRTLTWRTVLRMTRPGFLVVTFTACLLGFATARPGTSFPANAALAVVTLTLALLAHAAANVLNDYHDALNGADAANQDGLFPFTGGSRLIQNGDVTLQATRRLAWGLLILVALAGLLLAGARGNGLLLVGAAGLLLAWAYSAPPLALMSRGLGELAVAASWWLVVAGADFVLRGQFAALPLLVAPTLALLVANILLINGVPDAPADAAVGKRTLAVRLGPQKAARLYLLIALVAHGWLALGVLTHWLPTLAWWGLVSLPTSLWAAHLLSCQIHQPTTLRPAIKLTIATAVLHSVALAGGLFSR